MCCNCLPTRYLPTTAAVAGSMTHTSPESLCGTYTSGLAVRAVADSALADAAAYTLCGLVTGGIPGSPSFVTTCTGADVGGVVGVGMVTGVAEQPASRAPTRTVTR